MRQSQAGVVAPSSWRREALGAYAWGRARCQSCIGRSLHPAASPAAHPRTRRAGRDDFPAAAAALVRRSWSAGRGRAASGSAGVLRRLHPARVRPRAAARGTVWLQLLRRPLQTLRRAREPSRRRRQRREPGEAPLVQMQSAQPLERNRLQTPTGDTGGGARRSGTGKAAGNERDGTLPPPRPRCPPTSRAGVRDGDRGRGLNVC